MRTIWKEMFGDLTAVGHFWLRVGLVTLLASVAMSMHFGFGVSAAHALFLGCLSVVTAFAPESAYRQWEMGRSGVAAGLAIICVPLLAIEFYSHAGYTAGLRGQNISVSRVQNTKYDAEQKNRDSEVANLDLWKQQLKSLLEQNAWATSVKAEALRDQVVVADKEIELETARGGCKTKCAARMKDKADLLERIGKIEQATDLSKRIEATQRLVDKKVETAAAVEHSDSWVEHQNDYLAKTVALFSQGSLKPTAVVEAGAQQSVTLAMAFAGTGLPSFAIFMCGLYRRRDQKAAGPFNPLSAATHAAEHTDPARVETAAGRLAAAVPPSVVPAAAHASQSPAGSHRGFSLKANTLADLRASLQRAS